jgi:hypothetical protein
MPRGIPKQKFEASKQGVTKLESVRQALASLGSDAQPLQIQDFIKSKFGIDMERQRISVNKSILTKEAGQKKTATRKAGNNQQGNGESISGYFRKVFRENPKLLKSRSNAELLDRWLKDHPGEKEAPERVRQNLSNVKSVLRKRRRKRAATKQAEEQPEAVQAAPIRPKSKGLDLLEEQVDECLTLARNLDREGLASVIGLLRRARNEIVWKTGQ